MKTAVSWDGEGQRLRRKTTGVESGISNNRKRLPHTDTHMLPPELFLRDGDKQSPSTRELFYVSI